MFGDVCMVIVVMCMRTWEDMRRFVEQAQVDFLKQVQLSICLALKMASFIHWRIFCSSRHPIYIREISSNTVPLWPLRVHILSIFISISTTRPSPHMSQAMWSITGSPFPLCHPDHHMIIPPITRPSQSPQGHLIHHRAFLSTTRPLVHQFIMGPSVHHRTIFSLQ